MTINFQIKYQIAVVILRVGTFWMLLGWGVFMLPPFRVKKASKLFDFCSLQQIALQVDIFMCNEWLTMLIHHGENSNFIFLDIICRVDHKKQVNEHRQIIINENEPVPNVLLCCPPSNPPAPGTAISISQH